MNDRPQGGSAFLGNNTIELMQGRRTTDDDAKGVVEALNETDAQGFGVQVNARYFMHIFDFKRSKSLQRNQQVLTDQPLQLFYVFNKQAAAEKIMSANATAKKQHKSII